MSKYKYDDSEKELLKVLKMQENDLASLSEEMHEQSADIADLKQRTEDLLKNKGMTYSMSSIASDSKESKVVSTDIPSWESIVNRSNQKIEEEVIIEDLLSAEEFQFCVDEIERINCDFQSRTKLNNKDIAFIVVATALQTARWLIIQQLFGDLGQTIDTENRLSAKEGDKLKHEPLKEFATKNEGHENKSGKYPSWQQILWGTYPREDGGMSSGNCPYDAQQDAPNWFEDGGRGSHRHRTLGHDPILGWIFGVANLMTSTITLSNFDSYRVCFPGNRFDEPIDTISVFAEAIESLQEDWLRLPAAVVAHKVHLKSDYLTKAGLPLPIVGVLSNELAGELYKSQYDSLCLLGDIKIIGSQAIVSILINMITGLVHGLYYDENKDGERRFYEARTRKILLISNALASAGNITYAVCTEDWKKLDAGGILVTLYRVFSDVRFITKLKKDFIQMEMDKVLDEELVTLNSHFE